jgi:hypothetical protein
MNPDCNHVYLELKLISNEIQTSLKDNQKINESNKNIQMIFLRENETDQKRAYLLEIVDKVAEYNVEISELMIDING